MNYLKKIKNAIKFVLFLLFIVSLGHGLYYLRNNFDEILNNEHLVSLKNIVSNDDNPYIADINGSVVEDDDLSSLEDSAITYQEQDFDTTYYPYYGMLNTNGKKLYNQLYANINHYATSFKPKMTVTIEETENAIEAIYNDHPEFFWLDSTFSYKYSENDRVVQITLTYNNTLKNITNNKKAFESNAETIINYAQKLNTDYEKEKYVHDVLNNNIEYDKSSSYNQTAYSALVTGKTVCAGYARAFQYIMNKLKIPTFYVTGTSSNEAHAWNIVKLSDGYYNIDLTWDDSTKNYTYFNLPDSTFYKTHTRGNLSVNLPSCKGYQYTWTNIINEARKKENEQQNYSDNYNNHYTVTEPHHFSYDEDNYQDNDYSNTDFSDIFAENSGDEVENDDNNQNDYYEYTYPNDGLNEQANQHNFYRHHQEQ